jgi:hypothetical protein
VKHRVNHIFDIDIVSYVMVNKGKILISSKVSNVPRVTRNEIVHCDDGVTLRQKTVTQMRPQEACTTCDKYTQVKNPFVKYGLETSASLPQLQLRE